jgi:hypothetical protein
MAKWTHAALLQALENIPLKDKNREILRQAFALDENINGKMLTSCKVATAHIAILFFILSSILNCLHVFRTKRNCENRFCNQTGNPLL